ncbi:hypothetical protein LCGC14_2843590 [marine sediment metagenome]|uniref:BRCT domain-containing protein n=1 Tax=marine sediment metagenome TaxID=412755 RepID=A0A0F9B1L9_9ZZZZ
MTPKTYNQKYDEWFNAQLTKVGDWSWNETGVDAVLTNAATNDEAFFKQVVDFFTSIEAPHLKEGSVAKMFNNGFDTIEKIILAEEIDFIVALGKTGEKVYEGLRNRLNNIYYHDLIGSTPFFGRGVGKRKFKKLFETIDHDDLFSATTRDIVRAEGFDEKTARKIISGLTAFRKFMRDVGDEIAITKPKMTGITMDGQKVVFTGFRDKGLQAEVEANGGTMQSGVSGKTTILVATNPTSTSGKMTKARNNGTLIVGVDEFKEMLQ